MSNMLQINNAQVLLDSNFTKANLLINDGVIADISTSAIRSEVIKIVDASDLFVVPGFIDIHMHGAMGIDITNADINGLSTISEFVAYYGTTAWVASIISETEEITKRCIDTILAFMQSNYSGAELLGIHLEGPFLNKELAGAMSPHLLRKGDLSLFERLRERAGDALKYITLAPEVEGVAEMICTIAKSGVRVSMGHTNADYSLTMRCIKDGVTGVTHTFNAMRLFHQHEPAVMGAALESDIYCEAICDGFHLHPGSVRMLLKAKGYDRVIAVTDSTMAAGMPDGIHKIGDKEIIVENGDAKLVENGVRAGSTLTSLKALHNLQAFTGEPVEKLSALLSANPAKFIGLSDRKGSISKGFDADIVILDKNSNLTMTIAGGRIVYEKR